MNDEIETLAKVYAGPDFRERRSVHVNHVYASCDTEWTLNEFISLLNEIPIEFRDTANVRYESGYYDSGDCFRVSYYRPETDDEVNNRIQDAIAYANGVKRDERAAYERLKAKFEPSK